MRTLATSRSGYPKVRDTSRLLLHPGVDSASMLPYCISAGSKKFQKRMSRILEGLDGVECNIDDVLVHAPTRELHNKRLEQVLERLTTAGVTLNIEKCVFRATRIKFLGNVVSAHGIEVDPDKVAAVIDLPVPKNVHEVRVFLGMVNHLSKFAEHLPDKTKPIREEGPPVGLGTTPTKGI